MERRRGCMARLLLAGEEGDAGVAEKTLEARGVMLGLNETVLARVWPWRSLGAMRRPSGGSGGAGTAEEEEK